MPAIDVDAGLYEGSATPPGMAGTPGVRVRFYLDAIEDVKASKAAGKPVWRDVEFIEKRVLGDEKTIIQVPATEDDKRKWPQQYALFRQGDSEQVVGFPLKEWPGITKARVMELAHHHIRTVEQLAEVSDGNLATLGPIRDLRDRAKDYVAKMKGEAPTNKIRAELEEERKKSRAMRAELDELKELLNKKTKP